MNSPIIAFFYLSKDLHHCSIITSLVCCLLPHSILEEMETIFLEIHVLKIVEFGNLLEQQNVKRIFQKQML